MLGVRQNDWPAKNRGTGSIPCSPMSARNCNAAATNAIR